MNTLYIKNMVCDRCKAAIKNELEKSSIDFNKIELGEVILTNSPTSDQLNSFKSSIKKIGFELIEDKAARLVSQIKLTIINWVHGKENQNKKLKFSAYLTEQLHKDYTSLSGLFSSVENTTIEQYLIHQKIERAKELLVYNEYSLGEIADQLAYSSVQHLSTQFKKITGLTPSHFRKVGAAKRLSLDKV